MTATLRTRGRDDLACVAREAVDALDRSDARAASEAVEHLLVLDDEQRRDLRSAPEVDDEDEELATWR